MGRIWALLKRDWQFLLFVPVLILLIPTFIFAMTYFSSNKEVIIGAYGSGNIEIPYNTKVIASLKEGEQLLKEGTITAFYDKTNNKLYGALGKEQQTNNIYNKIFPSKANSEYADMEKEKIKNMLPFLCSIGVLFFSFAAFPILEGSSGFDVIKITFTTPLTYKEYLIEKLSIIFSCFIIFCLLAYFIMSKPYGDLPLNALGAFLIGFAALTFLLTINSTIVGFFTNEDTADVVKSIIVNLLLLIEIYSLNNNYSLPLPLSKGFYSTIMLNKFPLGIFLFLTISSIIMFYIAGRLFRVKLKS